MINKNQEDWQREKEKNEWKKIRFECGALCKQRDRCMDDVKEPTAYSFIFSTQ